MIPFSLQILKSRRKTGQSLDRQEEKKRGENALGGGDDDAVHLELTDSTQVVEHQHDLVLAVVLERHKAAVRIGDVGDECEHLLEQLARRGDLDALDSGLVVDAHAELHLVRSERVLSSSGSRNLTVEEKTSQQLASYRRLAAKETYMAMVETHTEGCRRVHDELGDVVASVKVGSGGSESTGNLVNENDTLTKPNAQ